MSKNIEHPLTRAIQKRQVKPTEDDEGRGFNEMMLNIEDRIDFDLSTKWPELDQSANILMRAIINKDLQELMLNIHGLSGHTESPIELLLYHGFILTAISQNVKIQTGYVSKRDKCVRKSVFYHPLFFDFMLEGDYPTITLLPQYNIGDYRVDFLIEYEINDFRSNIIVECDGHDFHEKTKQQASKDKKRDRLLQSVGYRIFHFTGSDIWKDPLSCAEEVYSLFDQDWHKYCLSTQNENNQKE